MKYWFLLLLAIGLWGGSIARGKSKYAPAVKESEITDVGTPETVSVSTSAWTKVPTVTLSTRSGFIVSLPATANANMVGHFGDCTSTAMATTVRPIELIKGNGFSLFPVDTNVCLYLLSLHTSAENVHVQEVGQ